MYDEPPKMKRDSQQKKEKRKKTAFLLGISLHFRKFVLRYVFSKFRFFRTGPPNFFVSVLTDQNQTFRGNGTKAISLKNMKKQCYIPGKDRIILCNFRVIENLTKCSSNTLLCLVRFLWLNKDVDFFWLFLIHPMLFCKWFRSHCALISMCNAVSEDFDLRQFIDSMLQCYWDCFCWEHLMYYTRTTYKYNYFS